MTPSEDARKNQTRELINLSQRREGDSNTATTRPETGDENSRSAQKHEAPAVDDVTGPATVVDVAERAKPEGDAIETALAEALKSAVTAGRFDVVAQLAREIEARRLPRSKVVRLADRKRSSK